MNLCFLHGSRTEDRDIKGMTAVHFASMNGFISILSSLRAHGAELDTRDNKGRTPLMFAAQNNQIVVFLFFGFPFLGGKMACSSQSTYS